MSAVSPARRAAFDVVRRVFEDGAWADRVLRGAAAQLDERDRALAQRLAYGTVQRVRTLDHAVEILARRPVKRIDAPVLAALRLGAYQLGYLDGVPRYAAVNESRRAGAGGGCPPRSVIRERCPAAARRGTRSATRRAARVDAYRGGAPSFVSRLGGRDMVARPRRRRAPARYASAERARRRSQCDSSAARSTAGPIRSSRARCVVERVDEAAVEHGRIWPQSRGSQLVGHVVGAVAGERVLDLCAAPGGKATMLAGEVVAVELSESRARELEENVAASRRHERPRRARRRRASCRPTSTGFDRALVDAPCSGLGVLAARPDLRWRAEPLPGFQLELLRAAAARVRPGGTVVYSVCTVNADECEAVVDASGLEPVPLGADWPSFAHRTRPEFLQTLPHVHRTSGFFVARLRVA